jgi:hypothetical protein
VLLGLLGSWSTWALVKITYFFASQAISTQLHDVISEIVDVDPETEDGKRKLDKLVDRDVTKIRNDVERYIGCPIRIFIRIFFLENY